MNVLYEIKEKLYRRLEESNQKREINDNDLERVRMLTDTIKNIDKICMMQDGGMSHDGEWEAEMRGSYADSPYSERRGRDRMGRFTSRDGGSYEGGSYAGDSYGSYGNGYSGRMSSRDSYGGGSGKLKEELEEMYKKAKSEPEREAIRHFMDMLKS